MTKHINYKTQYVCSRNIDIELDGTKIVSVKFNGGCAGNTQGLSALLVGMEVDDAIERLRGIRCGFKSTSCPDQLSKALLQYKEENNM